MPLSEKKPPWLKRRLPATGRSGMVMNALKSRALHTVCEEARCPNQMECYGQGTATFLLLGPGCTRDCSFCAVDKSRVHPVDENEPTHIAEAVAQMSLRYCVLTMVTRDDLPDGGAGHVARTLNAIRGKNPGIIVEALISDLKGDWDALGTVLAARPDVLNHNLETVPRLYATVRPQADYGRSLALIARAADLRPPLVIKSGLMLGLGENRDEILAVMDDLLESGCQLLTLGQYLAPSKKHHPIIRYVPPDEFEAYETEGLARGFHGVASAPLVRSSYQAEQMYKSALDRHNNCISRK
ncbi:MAG: lipoyl synthase [Deltaproteobacteria bacterium]|nr:lipoyl synthase [Deltaproteobacteria bacterium]